MTTDRLTRRQDLYAELAALPCECGRQAWRVVRTVKTPRHVTRYLQCQHCFAHAKVVTRSDNG